ncbi:MAG: hypothetical protein ACOX4D_06845 [Bacteroidales bacterium]
MLKYKKSKNFKLFTLACIFIIFTFSISSFTTNCSFAVNNVEVSPNIIDSLVIPDKIYGRPKR